jgi:predicted ABC-type sugar transport system permease subunit
VSDQEEVNYYEAIKKQARIVHKVILGKEAFGVCGNVKLFKVEKIVILTLGKILSQFYLCEQAEFHTSYWLM